MTLNESKSFRMSLECMKIFGENVLLGGSGGFIGVGVLGKGTGIRGNWAAAHRKVSVFFITVLQISVIGRNKMVGAILCRSRVEV